MEKHTSTKAHTSVLHITSVRLAEGGGTHNVVPPSEFYTLSGQSRILLGGSGSL